MQDRIDTLMVLQLLRELSEELKGLRQEVQHLSERLSNESVRPPALGDAEMDHAFEILAQAPEPKHEDED